MSNSRRFRKTLYYSRLFKGMSPSRSKLSAEMKPTSRIVRALHTGSLLYWVRPLGSLVSTGMARRLGPRSPLTWILSLWNRLSRFTASTAPR